MASKRFGLLVFVFGVLLCQQSLVSGEEDSLAFVKKTVQEQPVVIFSKSYCPYCKRAKAIFAELNEKPYVIELDEREDGGAIQQALAKYIGRSTVPQVFINGEHIGGSDDTVAAHRNGRLVKLLKKSTTSQKEQSQESEL